MDENDKSWSELSVWYTVGVMISSMWIWNGKIKAKERKMYTYKENSQDVAL